MNSRFQRRKSKPLWKRESKQEQTKTGLFLMRLEIPCLLEGFQPGYPTGQELENSTLIFSEKEIVLYDMAPYISR